MHRDSEWLQNDRNVALQEGVRKERSVILCMQQYFATHFHLLSSSTTIRRKSSPLGRSEEPTRASSHRSRSSASILLVAYTNHSFTAEMERFTLAERALAQLVRLQHDHVQSIATERESRAQTNRGGNDRNLPQYFADILVMAQSNGGLDKVCASSHPPPLILAPCAVDR